MVWDLGGYNRCPLMKYKLDLTGAPLPRPQALCELLIARDIGPIVITGSDSPNPAPDQRRRHALPLAEIRNGVVLENVSVKDLS
jgi:hypothetical protein